MPNKTPSNIKKKRGRPAKTPESDEPDSALCSALNSEIDGDQSKAKKPKPDQAIEVYLLPSYYDESCIGGRRMLHSKGCTRLKPQVSSGNSTASYERISDLYALEENEGASDLFMD